MRHKEECGKEDEEEEKDHEFKGWSVFMLMRESRSLTISHITFECLEVGLVGTW